MTSSPAGKYMLDGGGQESSSDGVNNGNRTENMEPIGNRPSPKSMSRVHSSSSFTSIGRSPSVTSEDRESEDGHAEGRRNGQLRRNLSRSSWVGYRASAEHTPRDFDTTSHASSAFMSFMGSVAGSDRTEAILRRKEGLKQMDRKPLAQRLREKGMRKALQGIDEGEQMALISQSQRLQTIQMRSLSLQTLLSLMPFEFRMPPEVMHEYQKGAMWISIVLSRVISVVAPITLTIMMAFPHILSMITEGKWSINTVMIVRYILIFTCHVTPMLTAFFMSFIPGVLKSPLRVHIWSYGIMMTILAYMLADKAVDSSKSQIQFIIFIVAICSMLFRLMSFWAMVSFNLATVLGTTIIDLVFEIRPHIELMRILYGQLFTSSISLAVWTMLSLQDRRSFLRRYITEQFNMESENEKLRNHSLLANIFPQRIIEQVTHMTEAMNGKNSEEDDDTMSAVQQGQEGTESSQKKSALERLRSQMISESHDNVTIMFVTMIDFSRRTAFLAASQIVSLLSQVFTEFDLLIEMNGLYRVKTIGSNYMCAAGLTSTAKDQNGNDLDKDFSLYQATDTALSILEIVHEYQFGIPMLDTPIEVGIGINFGPVVAGVIGTKTLAYDVWANSVNVASRMSSLAEPGTIFMTRDTYRRLRRLEKSNGTLPYRLKNRKGKMFDVKGKGQMHVFALHPGAVDTTPEESPQEARVLSARRHRLSTQKLALLEQRFLDELDAASSPSQIGDLDPYNLRIPEFLRHYLPSNERTAAQRGNRFSHEIKAFNFADTVEFINRQFREGFFDGMWVNEQLNAINEATKTLRRRQRRRLLVILRARNKVHDIEEEETSIVEDDDEEQNGISLNDVIQEVLEKEHAGAALIPEKFIEHIGKIKMTTIFHPILCTLRDKRLFLQCMKTETNLRWKHLARLIAFFSLCSFILQFISDLLFLFERRQSEPYISDSELWHWQLQWALISRLAIGTPVISAIYGFMHTRFFTIHFVMYNVTLFVYYTMILVFTSVVQLMVPLDMDTSTLSFVVQTMFIYTIPGFLYQLKILVVALTMTFMIAMGIARVNYGFLYVIVAASMFISTFTGYMSNRESQVDYFFRMLNYRKQEKLAIEQERVRELMNQVLPSAITRQLHTGQLTMTDGVLAQHYELAGVLFADLVDFTKISSRMTPLKLVAMLSEIYTAFDNIADKYHIEKIKLIGDSYHAASGIPIARKNHVLHLLLMGIEMIEYLESRNEKLEPGEFPIEFRIGVSCGSVVGGIVGLTRFAFDLFGRLVDEASSMESNGRPMHVHVSEQVYEHVESMDQRLVKLVLRTKDPVMNPQGTTIIPTYWVYRWSDDGNNDTDRAERTPSDEEGADTVVP